MNANSVVDVGRTRTEGAELYRTLGVTPDADYMEVMEATDRLKEKYAGDRKKVRYPESTQSARVLEMYLWETIGIYKPQPQRYRWKLGAYDQPNGKTRQIPPIACVHIGREIRSGNASLQAGTPGSNVETCGAAIFCVCDAWWKPEQPPHSKPARRPVRELTRCVGPLPCGISLTHAMPSLGHFVLTGREFEAIGHCRQYTCACTVVV